MRGDAVTAAPEPCQIGAVPLAATIRDRTVSSRDAVGACLDPIEATSPRVNAIVSPCPATALLAEAERVDEAVARGETACPWIGRPPDWPSTVPAGESREVLSTDPS